MRSRDRGPDQLSERGEDGVEVILPFRGRWVVRNSPARRVPSHGTDEFGARYAIDFVMVDDGGRTAPGYPARAVLRPEAVESFYAYGQRIHAPVAGTVVAAHDGERDREAGRSQLALIPFALTQLRRVSAGQVGVAGNHVVIAVGPDGPFVVVAHLRAGSVRVRVGDVVDAGDPVGECGSSGNSTQPHVHLQAMDRPDGASARGVPMLFRSFVEHPRDGGGAVLRRNSVPDEDSVVEVPAV
ncbi:M23 family metallopeptidase [Dietzia sp. B19]|nr:M23 family metallopeptidase [Dietzia sp. B19]